MFKTAVLLLAIASCAYAQTPQELLQLAQNTYKSPDGYEIKGRGVVQPPGLRGRSASKWLLQRLLRLSILPGLLRILSAGLVVNCNIRMCLAARMRSQQQLGFHLR
jgi:hypothetical protein